MRLALQAGNGAFARQIALPLPAAQAAPLLQWAALLESPRREIDALIACARHCRRECRAARRMDAARAQRSLRGEAALRRSAACAQARPRARPARLRWRWRCRCRGIAIPTRCATSRASRLRISTTRRASGMRARHCGHGSGSRRRRSIAAMSDATRRTARWRYWSARIAAHEDDDAAARPLYESLLTEDNYYSAMAAARLKQGIAPTVQAVPLEAAQLASIEKLPPIVRARELRLSGLVGQRARRVAIRPRTAAAHGARPGHSSRLELGLARSGRRHRVGRARVQRLRAAVSAPV